MRTPKEIIKAYTKIRVEKFHEIPRLTDDEVVSLVREIQTLEEERDCYKDKAYRWCKTAAIKSKELTALTSGSAEIQCPIKDLGDVT
jgi:hypothetical protein